MHSKLTVLLKGGDIMDFFDTVNARFSYRKRLGPEQPPFEDLKKIVQAGLDAPSGKNRQTTGFVIIRNEEIINAIKAMPGANGSMATAPCFIACHIEKVMDSAGTDLDFLVEDCSASVENILLGITAMGYAAVWIDGWLRHDNRAEKIGDLCGLPPHRIIRVLVPLGTPLEEQKRPDKKGFDERVIVV